MEILSIKAPGACAHCRQPFERPPARVGRMRVYCSDRCRRAAWDARARPGSDGVRVVMVERVVVEAVDLNECSRRVAESPVACRNVLRALQDLAEAGRLDSDPKWERAYKAFLDLRATLEPKPRGWR
ncbi:hypothetical protein E8D34_00950 [Nocardioides sp. GY 10113]|uniref:hypothetical protein n=1 Tax=Nocardioides sp. GY 10113 TaxID=2569761 RepID=UPI0010A8F852|nr:hypothetical protein [Nocardioides sp. GY 10113]TIC89104.1 hypothetical protein E8D34_00950 [Nocardioides sp. GY 10113]